jgi:hypothetical protein
VPFATDKLAKTASSKALTYGDKTDEMTDVDRATLEPGLDITVGTHKARVWLNDLSVECKSEVLRQRVIAVMEKAVETVASLGAE